MVYITSDLHLGHDKDFIYKSRGFDNIYDHDRTIIKNWNELITDEDYVYILGDIMLGDVDYGCSCFNQLCGLKHIIIGNHDTENKIERYKDLRGVIDINYADVLKYHKYSFYLSHYGSLTSNYKPLKKSLISLCGHTHTTDKFEDWDKGFIYHCELDAHGMKPINIEDIIKDLEDKYGN